MDGEGQESAGPPHRQMISESLQMWILFPALLVFLIVIGEYEV